MDSQITASFIVALCVGTLVSCSESTPDSGPSQNGTDGLGGAFDAETGGSSAIGAGGADVDGSRGDGSRGDSAGGSDGTGGSEDALTIPRGRPTLNAARTTFVAENGRLLRGPYTSSEWGDPAPREQLEAMKDLGFNAVHLYAECFDINYPAPGSSAPGYSEARIDTLVEATSELGLYLVITIGNGANNGNYNREYTLDFWEHYAPRYADETHVIYEIQNEPVGWSPPYVDAANGAQQMEVDAYQLIRSHAPDTPVLLFSYSVLWGSGAGDEALRDIRSFNQSVFDDEDAEWDNLAVGFHGYAGASNTASAIEAIMEAGYPTFMTEFHGGMWGSDVGGLDVELTHLLELLDVSWLTFVYVPPWGVSDDVTDPAVYPERVAKTGLSWTPDFGTFPAVRGSYGNDGLPWTVPGQGAPTGALRIQAEDFDRGGPGVAYTSAATLDAGQPYRPDESVPISQSSDSDGDYQVGDLAGGNWLEFTMKVPGGGLYEARLRVAGQATVRLYSRDEALTDAWSLPSTGGPNSWATATESVVLPGGLQRVRVAVEGGELNLNWIEFAPVSTGPVSEEQHQIQNADSNQILDADGNGSIVTNMGGRQWQLEHQGGGQYTFATGDQFWTTFQGPLHLTPFWGAEQFITVPVGGGDYHLMHTGGGLCLRPSSDDAPRMDLVACSDDAIQHWKIP